MAAQRDKASECSGKRKVLRISRSLALVVIIMHVSCIDLQVSLRWRANGLWITRSNFGVSCSLRWFSAACLGRYDGLSLFDIVRILFDRDLSAGSTFENLFFSFGS